MNFQSIWLCLSICFGYSLSNRVYIHPFNLFAYNKSECEKVEKQNHTIEVFFTPVSVETNISPEEETLGSTGALETKLLGTVERQRVSILPSLVNDAGFRCFNGWKETHKDDTILMSFTNLFGSLVSFYLGAPTHTSADLQAFLGFAHQSGDQDCVSKVDALKVISTLKHIDNRLFSKDNNIESLKMTCLFISEDVPLSETFIHNLIPSADKFYVRGVDFTNPTKAVDLINKYLNTRSTKKGKYILTPVDASANILFMSYIHFKGKLKNAYLIPEPQDFWVEPGRKIATPMISLSGMFHYKQDINMNQIIVKVPLGENDFMLLIQPINENTLENIESSLSWHTFLKWLENLSSRHINLSLPKMEIESSYDIQDILSNMELSYLLGKKADFTKISNVELTVGKIINKVHFELEESGEDANKAQDIPVNKNDQEPMEIKFEKPFYFVVFEGTTKALLFIGRVKSPLSTI
ncbi:angiotensinogen [Xenopus laevis]|uniref:Angiotensinogen n=2 Tax=Xenopus laevis TaxID=8355 RepID=A0A1L8G2D7_XENLA|nr:angiotensinogen [Xenopus laevis]OCT77957.1 hypothetical protein XELAEV_18029055mg [Xenopus laevis]